MLQYNTGYWSYHRFIVTIFKWYQIQEGVNDFEAFVWLFKREYFSSHAENAIAWSKKDVLWQLPMWTILEWRHQRESAAIQQECFLLYKITQFLKISVLFIGYPRMSYLWNHLIMWNLLINLFTVTFSIILRTYGKFPITRRVSNPTYRANQVISHYRCFKVHTHTLLMKGFAELRLWL